MHHLGSILLTLLFLLFGGNFSVAKNQASSAPLGDLGAFAVQISVEEVFHRQDAKGEKVFKAFLEAFPKSARDFRSLPISARLGDELFSVPLRRGKKSKLANPQGEGNIQSMIAVAELIEEALNLPRTDRSYLASKLLESLDEDDSEMSEEWKSELDRRLKDIDEGKVEMIPHAQVMANMQVMLEQIRLERAEKAS